MTQTVHTHMELETIEDFTREKALTREVLTRGLAI
jgi:hypothetical protein